MSKYKDLVKNGWHPEKNSSSSGSKPGIRGQVSGMIPGRNKNQQDADRANHVSAPLESLIDPASFAPPPKRTGSGLAPAPPPSTVPRKVITAPSKYQDPRSSTPAVPPPKISSERELEQLEAAPPPVRGPYRTNTTGLSTENLPKPPARRGVPQTPPNPPSYEAATGGGGRPVPSLPPRLPARTNTGGSAESARGNDSSMLNQSAVNRLGAAGVSVPGFGIHSAPGTNAAASPPPPERPTVGPAQVNSLQNRFARLGTSSAGSSPAAEPPSSGTTWQQKQAALKTASSFQKDPSSVSLSDAKSAASTANNFRQRHGEQVAAGVKSANNLNQKYGVADRVGALAGQSQQQEQPAGGMAAVAGKKKPPPPPPKRKPGLAAAVQQPASEDAPPPIPLSTRPTF